MSRPTHLQASSSATDPDADLVRGLKCGEPESFRFLLQLYQNPIYSYVCRLIDDPLEAEDVTQDVFVKVFRKVGGFREECRFKTWLYRIATRESSNRRRWFSRHRWREVTGAFGQGAASAYVERLHCPGRGPFEQTENREHRDMLNDALKRINPRFREAVVLRDIAGFSYLEIASTLGIALGTVKSRILRGRLALKHQLMRHAPAIVPHRTWQTE
jgi:RNA polymerase sigma-70 factor (ECF subfamily)